MLEKQLLIKMSRKRRKIEMNIMMTIEIKNLKKLKTKETIKLKINNFKLYTTLQQQQNTKHQTTQQQPTNNTQQHLKQQQNNNHKPISTQ